MPKMKNITELITIHEELITLHQSIAKKSKDQLFIKRHHELAEMLQATITELKALKNPAHSSWA